MFFSAPAVIILIGTVLAGMGALWAANNQKQFELELKAKQVISVPQ